MAFLFEEQVCRQECLHAHAYSQLPSVLICKLYFRDRSVHRVTGEIKFHGEIQPFVTQHLVMLDRCSTEYWRMPKHVENIQKCSDPGAGRPETSTFLLERLAETGPRNVEVLNLRMPYEWYRLAQDNSTWMDQIQNLPTHIHYS